MKDSSSVILFLIAVAAAQADPGKAVALAAQDLATQPKAIHHRLRYFTDYAIEESLREERSKAYTFWTNALSTEAEMIPLIRIVPILYRINIDNYGSDESGESRWRTPWEKLRKVDPYFHEKFRSKKGNIITRTARWLPSKEMAYLIDRTQSTSPILRIDWFLARTGQQEGRAGTGYYDFLGLKSRKDVERLIGFNRKASERVKRQVRGIIGHSAVAHNNRQIEREEATTGGYWRTLDVTTSIGNKNAIRNLYTDYKHEFEEHFYFLPNQLFGYYLSDANGVQANVAPPNVASDSTSPTPDRQVHVGISCARCHKEGLRPINDIARRIYTPPVFLQSPSFKRFLKLRQLYISDLKRWYLRDIGDYSQALILCNQTTPEQNARIFATAFQAYNDDPLRVEDVARELGIPMDDLFTKVKLQTTATGMLDTGIAQFLHANINGSIIGLGNEFIPLTMRRDQFEENYSLLQAVVQGYEP